MDRGAASRMGDMVLLDSVSSRSRAEGRIAGEMDLDCGVGGSEGLDARSGLHFGFDWLLCSLVPGLFI